MGTSKPMLRISDLHAICDKIFVHIREDLQVTEIELEQDYYWNINDDELFDVDHRPTKHDIGSLSEDLDFCHPGVEDDYAMPSLMFIHVAPLLRYIAMKVGQ